MWIKEIVSDLISKYGTNNPFEIAEAKNIHVVEFALDKEIYGFYKYIRRNKFIYINSDLQHEQKRLTCAHELGHSELHPRISTPFLKRKTHFSLSKIEQEANQFAAELLIPDDEIYKYNNMNLTVSEIGYNYAVPQEVVEFKRV